MPEDVLAELRKKYEKERGASSKMCSAILWGPPGVETPHPGCNILNASLFSAKNTLPKGSSRRVFIQDLVAALDRRDLIKKDKYSEFLEAGLEYMEA